LKKLSLILLIFILNCSPQKEIQGSTVILTLDKIIDGDREGVGKIYWLRWVDGEGLVVWTSCACPQYKEGDTMTYLITR
jgi:hypothetical protein